MLIMLEGPDGAGKTTLAETLLKMPEFSGAVYDHCGPETEKDSLSLAQGYMRRLRSAFDGPMVLDRGWLSEPIYSAVYRQIPSRITKLQQRMLERAALQLGARVVLCLPPWEAVEHNFQARRDDELLKDTHQLRQVYDAYERGLETQLPVYEYDFTRQTPLGLLEELGARDIAPRAVLLGERSTTKTGYQSAYQVPFVSFNSAGCSSWLAEQLEEASIPENQLRWFNAYSTENTPLDPKVLPPGVPVIALGNRASGWCREYGIIHRRVPHPQHHKRFFYGIEYPLIPVLKEVLA